jgi:hypothetical protein
MNPTHVPNSIATSHNGTTSPAVCLQSPFVDPAHTWYPASPVCASCDHYQSLRLVMCLCRSEEPTCRYQYFSTATKYPSGGRFRCLVRCRRSARKAEHKRAVCRRWKVFHAVWMKCVYLVIRATTLRLHAYLEHIFTGGCPCSPGYGSAQTALQV